MYTIYNLLLNLAFIISLPYLLLRAALGKHGIRERMGRLPQRKLARIFSEKVIWFHAASVGEIKALSTIIPQFKKDHPEYALAVSALTKSGKQEAEDILKEIAFAFFLPVDLKSYVRRALDRIRPVALILVETELWPNLIKEAKGRGCLVALINGRISETSFRKYFLARRLFSETFSHIDLLCMQSEEHKQRIRLLGTNSNKIRVTGNLKFDRLLYARQTEDKAELKKRTGIPDRFKIIMGGSVRSGEEKILIRVFRKLKQEDDNLALILAPRHLDRIKEIERILSYEQTKSIRKSQLDKKIPWDEQSVILLDTMGELSALYALADVAFVGGSLVPVGGHNLLEPAIYGVPVLFGPHVEHFKEEAKILIESGGGIKVKDEEELYLSLLRLLSDDEKRRKLGENAKEALQKETGASKRTTDLIFSHLEKI